MQPLGIQEPPFPRAQWPSWTLLAFTPIALSVGIIGGMAIAHYFATQRDSVNPVTQPAKQTASPTTGKEPTSGTGLMAMEPPPDPRDIWKIPTSQRYALRTVDPDPTKNPFLNDPVTNSVDPARAYGPKTAETSRDARALLQARFSSHTAGGVTISGIEYQLMRHKEKGVTMVGILTQGAYDQWVKALGNNPADLAKWLEQAAEAIKPAAERNHLFLTWALVDVTRARPDGFADYEVTPLANRTYLVIRPLAASSDTKMTSISIRSTAHLTPGDAQGVTTAYEPWATYRPVINWDSTDLYRPADAMWTRPFSTP